MLPIKLSYAMRCEGRGYSSEKPDERCVLIEWNVVCLAMHTADVGGVAAVLIWDEGKTLRCRVRLRRWAGGGRCRGTAVSAEFRWVDRGWRQGVRCRGADGEILRDRRHRRVYPPTTDFARYADRAATPNATRSGPAPLARARRRTGQESLRFPRRWEDSATMAAQAAAALLGRMSGAEIASLRYLVVGTRERRRSGQAGGGACAGHAAARRLRAARRDFHVRHSARLRRRRDRGLASVGAMLAVSRGAAGRGLIICTDEARYAPGSSAEITQGAAAVALLVEPDPRLLELDFTAIGYASRDVDDFFRPARLGHGAREGAIFDRLLPAGRWRRRCWTWATAPAATWPRCWRETDLFALHVPFRSLPEETMVALVRRHLGADAEAAARFLAERQFAAGTALTAVVGNVYSRRPVPVRGVAAGGACERWCVCPARPARRPGGLRLRQHRAGVLGTHPRRRGRGGGELVPGAPDGSWGGSRARRLRRLDRRLRRRARRRAGGRGGAGGQLLPAGDSRRWLPDLRIRGTGAVSASVPAGGAATAIGRRTEHHLDICVDDRRYPDPAAGGTSLDEVRLVHQALPELDYGAIDTGQRFLRARLRLPLLISCMTGGSGRGRSANRALAEAAERAGIAVGVGSIRPLLRDPDTFADFHVKPHAPDVPVLANLGAVQLRDPRRRRPAAAAGAAGGTGAGDPPERRPGAVSAGTATATSAACWPPSPVPWRAAGCRCWSRRRASGSARARVRLLLGYGVRYVDVAGAGGTNWIAVEGERLAAAERHSARAFDDWGLPTGVLLAALGADDAGRVIASGGLRHGVHLAKAVALGAGLGAMALPFIRAVMAGGTDGVLALIARIEHELRVAMTLCGAPTLAALRRAPVMQSAAFRHQVDELRRATSGASGAAGVHGPGGLSGPVEACGPSPSAGGANG